ncbi:spike base protein, RCAP_Rcc01079 family [Citreimonas sp.]|uniref:spike base protein, RCAP_Rcc01079 family n=1 Tax=Citreimonas sp. TaxID=3036715 RepID=UPI004058E680
MDDFSAYTKSASDPGYRHFALAADAGADVDPRPRAIYCEAAGTITIADEVGEELPYTMEQGQVLPFWGVRITAISAGTFYGWV